MHTRVAHTHNATHTPPQLFNFTQWERHRNVTFTGSYEGFGSLHLLSGSNIPDCAPYSTTELTAMPPTIIRAFDGTVKALKVRARVCVYACVRACLSVTHCTAVLDSPGAASASSDFVHVYVCVHRQLGPLIAHAAMIGLRCACRRLNLASHLPELLVQPARGACAAR